jgi:hypothetical protein
MTFNLAYDDGSDGCMPAGWYVTELDAIGNTVVTETDYYVVKNEYGPYESKEVAEEFISKAKGETK